MQTLGLEVKLEMASRSQSPCEATTTPAPIAMMANDSEKIEVLLNPMEMPTAAVNALGYASRQQSLLKPKSERVTWTVAAAADHVHPPAPAVAAPIANGLNSSRMRLQQALKNAKSLKKNFVAAAAAPAAAAAAAVIVVQPPVVVPAVAVVATPKVSPVKPLGRPLQIASTNSSPITSDDNSNATSSSSASRTLVVAKKRPKKTVPLEERISATKRARNGKSPTPTSSSGENDVTDLPDEDEEPTTLGKEAFMRVFGLCTQNFYTYLKARRSERKRRNVTSTERRDFHYGKLDLYEVSFFI